MKITNALREPAPDGEFDFVGDEERSMRRRRKPSDRTRAPWPRPANNAICPSARTRQISGREFLAVPPGVPDLSHHGRARLQQRGIAIDQVLTILDYGQEQRAHGASRYFLNRRGRERLTLEMPELIRSFRTLDIQVVIADDGCLITAAHRTKRIRREIQRNRRRRTNG